MENTLERGGNPVKEKSIGRPHTATVLDSDLSSLEREKKAIGVWLKIFKKDDKELEKVNAYCRGRIYMSADGGRSFSIDFYKI